MQRETVEEELDVTKHDPAVASYLGMVSDCAL